MATVRPSSVTTSLAIVHVRRRFRENRRVERGTTGRMGIARSRRRLTLLLLRVLTAARALRAATTQRRSAIGPSASLPLLDRNRAWLRRRRRWLARTVTSRPPYQN